MHADNGFSSAKVIQSSNKELNMNVCLCNAFTKVLHPMLFMWQKQKPETHNKSEKITRKNKINILETSFIFTVRTKMFLKPFDWLPWKLSLIFLHKTFSTTTWNKTDIYPLHSCKIFDFKLSHSFES